MTTEDTAGSPAFEPADELIERAGKYLARAVTAANAGQNLSYASAHALIAIAHLLMADVTDRVED